MKCAMMLLAPVALLAFAAACEETALPSGLYPTVSAKFTTLAKPLCVGDQTRDRLRLMDGSGEGEGSQHQYRGEGPGGGGSGAGEGDQLRLRDGSCGDGG